MGRLWSWVLPGTQLSLWLMRPLTWSWCTSEPLNVREGGAGGPQECGGGGTGCSPLPLDMFSSVGTLHCLCTLDLPYPQIR